MAERQPQTTIRHSIPPSRSLSQRSAASRLSSPIDVFSDDFALEPLNDPFESASSSSTVTPVQSRESVPNIYPSSQSRLVRPSTPPSGAIEYADLESTPRRSISKRPYSQRYAGAPMDRTQSTTSRVSMAASTVQRSSSVSSRFSIPRAPSPYNGATGPSHPYQMYPQITRTSTISTIRPNEGAFEGANGPEHPYAMYPQNTVPEEDFDEQVGAAIIPVGFPGMGQVYQRPAGDDVADIIGADGHLEQLPPYTRYPDDIQRKDHAAVADVTVAPSTTASSNRDVPLSEMTTLNDPVPMSDASTVREQNQNGGSPTKETFKERVKRNGKKRVCLGLNLWVITAMVGMLVFAATLGGVIGGVVGNRHGQKDKTPPPANVTSSSAPTTTVTATSWIDATPLASSTVLADIPTGEYAVPIGQAKSSSATCVVDLTIASVWGCLPPGNLGINVEAYYTGAEASEKYNNITIQPYPIIQNFSYGPQPPDLGGQTFELGPFMDKDATSLGPSAFFYTEYDKVVILPESYLSSSSSKRSISERELDERQYNGGGGNWHRNQMASPGDKPWFCYWNQTVLEFFIYVSQNTSQYSSTSSAAASSNGAAMTTAASATTSEAALVAVTSSSSTPTATAASKRSEVLEPRQGDYSHNSYPRYVKVEEKRKPDGNIAPYCVQMQILDNGWWNTVPGVPTLTVSEVESSATSASATTSAASAKFKRLARANEDRVDKRQTSSSNYCACEWLST